MEHQKANVCINEFNKSLMFYLKALLHFVDVPSCLKWTLLSNSVALVAILMSFVNGRTVEHFVHYVLLNADFSDAENQTM